MRYPLFSFRELSTYLELVDRALELTHSTFRVERIFVPEAKGHPQHYFKNEWVIDLYSPGHSVQLYFSTRSQACSFVLFPAKAFKPSVQATRSGFDLALHKNLVGSKLIALSSLKNDRVARLDFSGAGKFTLYLVFIPSQPDAILLDTKGELVASSKGIEAFTPFAIRELTDAQIEKIPYRSEWLTSVQTYAKTWLQAQEEEILALRVQRLQSLLSSQKSSLERKLISIKEQRTQSQEDPDWNYYGSLLQTHFYSNPVPKKGKFELLDYEKDEMILVPADPKLNLKQQLERFFHASKRNRTRLQEAGERIEAFEQKLKLTTDLLARLASAKNLNEVGSIEAQVGVSSEPGKTSPSKDQKKIAGFSGKRFQSKEGLTILAGRNLAENLELTFKIARGNDLWLHVKGKPGSHTVILLPPKKSASLDTLLDAANLCILYSGGKEWGKTEVDYTLRKYVKKIKNQSEVSYSNNKTLAVSIEQERLKRLTAEEK